MYCLYYSRRKNNARQANARANPNKKKDLLITTGVLLAKRNGLSGKAFGTSVAVLLKKKATQIKANPAKVWFDMKAAYGSKCTKMANDPSAYLQNVHDNMKKYDKK